MGRLVITADDYGYGPAYDRGIVEAAEAGAVDAVSVMVGEGRAPDPAPLTATGVAVGLHLELPRDWPPERDERLAAIAAELEAQWSGFKEIFGRTPMHLDGHLHCHAAPKTSVPVARFARGRDVPLRAVSPRHARLVRCIGAAAPDRLIGRVAETDPAQPAQIAALLDGEELPEGVTEWVVHPGHLDPGMESSYDAGREEDLALVLSLASSEPVRSRRSSHGAALAAASSAR